MAKERTVYVVHEESINAPAKIVFPLCCPVEEYRWIFGWKCELAHCPNDRVELGTVFSEILSAPFLMASGSSPRCSGTTARPAG